MVANDDRRVRPKLAKLGGSIFAVLEDADKHLPRPLGFLATIFGAEVEQDGMMCSLAAILTELLVTAFFEFNN